jgi:hypothetical protein
MTSADIRARVLGLQADRKPVPLDYDPWGTDLYIRVLSANDQVRLSEISDENSMPLLIVLHCLVDFEGERIFTDADMEALGNFPFPEVMEVFAKVAKLNGLSTDELDEAMTRFAQAPDEQRSTG